MDELYDKIKILAKRWMAGVITENEKEEFEIWYNSFDDSKSSSPVNRDSIKKRSYLQLLQRTGIKSRTAGVRQIKKRIYLAAAVLAGIIFSVWFFKPDLIDSKLKASNNTSVIVPGRNQAILTLVGGKKIFLIYSNNGRLAQQGDVNVVKPAAGSIAYNDTHQTKPSNDENLLETPKGGQYHLTLSDGSQVWLNAGSSIQFPVSFKGSPQRKVKINGEAYFEVSRDKTHPFVVDMIDQTVEVIGTHFNINSYQDEPFVRTTLLEGSVKVINKITGKMGILKPDEQSVVDKSTLQINVADTEEATAWKSGYFMFGGDDISSIMRRLSRWYDVDVLYDGPKPIDKFEGTVNRFGSVQQVLDKLELTGRVHFKIAGRRIMVSQ
jgi:transmembrane sensor